MPAVVVHVYVSGSLSGSLASARTKTVFPDPETIGAGSTEQDAVGGRLAGAGGASAAAVELEDGAASGAGVAGTAETEDGAGAGVETGSAVEGAEGEMAAADVDVSDAFFPYLFRVSTSFSAEAGAGGATAFSSTILFALNGLP